MAKFFASLAVIAAARLAAAWPLMLLIGIVHADWLTAVPPVGYWTAVLIQLLMGFGHLFLATGGALVTQIFAPGKTTGKPRRARPTYSAGEWERLFPRKTGPLRWNEPPL